MYSKCSNIWNTFRFSNKMMVFKAGIHKILVRIANGVDPDQTASEKSSLIWVCTVCPGIFMQASTWVKVFKD